MRRALPILLLLLLPSLAHAGEDEQPIVRVEVEPAHVVVGQPAQLRVTLLVPTWFPQPPEYPSFELPNAAIRLPSNRSYSISELRGRASWSGLVREYVFQPLQAGRFQIEGEKIRITYANPEGFQPKTVEIPMPVARLSAFVPEGAEDLEPFLSGRTLEISQEIEGDLEELKVGSAIKRIVEARIDGMAAMFLPPLIESGASAGMSSYAESPSLEDDGTRGERRESMTYVFEQGGSYRLPAIRLAYWNTESQQIEVAELPAIDVSVSGAGIVSAESGRSSLPWLVSAVALLALLALLARWLRWLPDSALARARVMRERVSSSEWLAWRRLVAALRRADAQRAALRFINWDSHPALGRSASRPRAVETLRDLAYGRATNAGAWTAALRRELVVSLRADRRARLDSRRPRAGQSLPPLNPASGEIES